ncbi:MAG: hypothetical protein N3F09_08500 [Bacteroidia bacterium]|nr:hypothetical protein [Bacteroidia bacterium]
MKKIIFVFLLCQLLFSQKGKIFPTINGVMLSERKYTVPEKNGKYTVLGIAFHRHAEDALKKWLNPLYYTFMKKPEKKGQFDVAEIYDVNFVFIPMISGFKKIAEEFKSSTDKQFWDYILDTEKTDVKKLQQELGISDNKIPYFFVLDKNGKILEMVSGDYKEDKIDQLEDAIE